MREAALQALKALGMATDELEAAMVQPGVAQPPADSAKIRAFAIGFVGWNLVNGLILLGSGPISSLVGRIPLDAVLALVMLSLAGQVLANPVALVVLAFKQRQAAWGLLSAFGLNALALILVYQFNLLERATYLVDTTIWDVIFQFFQPFWLLLVRQALR